MIFGRSFPIKHGFQGKLLQATSGNSPTVPQAAGTGVAGNIASSVLTGALAQAAGTGVAGALIANPGGNLVGVTGIGTAGLFGPSVSVTLAQAAGIGTVGGIVPQITSGSISVNVPRVAAIGVAGIITVSGVVSAVVAGGNGGINTPKKRLPAPTLPIARKGKLPKEYTPEAKPKPKKIPPPLPKTIEAPLAPPDPQPMPMSMPQPIEIAAEVEPETVDDNATIEVILQQMMHEEHSIKDTIISMLKQIMDDIHADLVGEEP